jgi:23S rRNA pseudouridine1911/1915/1917 synthase
VLLEVAVPVTAAGERLDRFLAAIDAIGSRAEAERLVGEGRALVDGARRAKSHRLAGGETVSIEVEEPPAAALEPEEIEVVISYEDDRLLVIDKSAGIVVHPSAGHAGGTLVHGLLARGIAGGKVPERPGVVHRLDKNTSGLLVLARDPETHRRLQRLIRRRDLLREYLALVCGRPRSLRGRIEAAIGRDRTDPTRISLDSDRPRPAITHFEIAELLAGHSLLRVRLETGRTHQIRVHLAAIDLPVAGDPVYGRPGELGLERQFLHAAHLAFDHPWTGARVDVASALPPELETALIRARGESPTVG